MTERKAIPNPSGHGPWWRMNDGDEWIKGTPPETPEIAAPEVSGPVEDTTASTQRGKR